MKEAVWSCDGNKAPGPYGFNFNFIKKFWGSLKPDFWGMLEEFRENAKLSKMFLSYFLALIPKTKNPQVLGDFRPISLLGCLYKVLAKLLAARLKKVLNISLLLINRLSFRVEIFLMGS